MTLDAEGPFPQYTLIFCRNDEHADAKIAAFADQAEAAEHARLRLLARPDEWISVMLAHGVDEHVAFVGSWDRDHEGALRWKDASLM